MAGDDLQRLAVREFAIANGEWCFASELPTHDGYEYGEHCWLCSGEACNLCGAGCWDNDVTDCDHDVEERHREPAS